MAAPSVDSAPLLTQCVQRKLIRSASGLIGQVIL
jgi:hypothetical protein